MSQYSEVELTQPAGTQWPGVNSRSPSASHTKSSGKPRAWQSQLLSLHYSTHRSDTRLRPLVPQCITNLPPPRPVNTTSPSLSIRETASIPFRTTILR